MQHQRDIIKAEERTLKDFVQYPYGFFFILGDSNFLIVSMEIESEVF